MCPRLLNVRIVATVVILCGMTNFVEDFMFTAENMRMTNPDEYVYLLTLYNAVDVSQPWMRSGMHGTGRNAATAFKPVLQVR